MVPSAFNVRATLASGDVFLMNTLTDAQLVVSPEAAGVLDGMGGGADAIEAMTVFAEHGFVVPDRRTERDALEARFAALRDDAADLHVTVLTTLQCNFACEYCYQGDQGGPTSPADRMSAETAADVADWVARELDRVRPGRLMITFFGGEPLLNLPATCTIAERCAAAARALDISVVLTIVTNGLLLTPAVVERLLPFGLAGVKVTLDGDRDTHDRLRPLRGGQGTFDRIVENVRRVAPLVPVSIGGNFDAATADRYPELIAFLKAQPFAEHLADVTFKPVILPGARIRGFIPVNVVGTDVPHGCGNGRTTGAASVCDSCHVADDVMSFLRAETRRHGFRTTDGVHMGPCELYRRHSHTIGPDGTMYPCPGFTGEHARPVGHITRATDPIQTVFAGQFASLEPWRQCGDCAFIPVCGGGCAVAAHAEQGDAALPACHKRAFETAIVNLAAESAAHIEGA